MRNLQIRQISLFFLTIFLTTCATRKPATVEIPSDIPQISREFRAVWVATVANIDWPSEPGLSPEIQRQEAIAILDSVKSLNMNAVIFQVRPQCDALYLSTLEPWSYYLTGNQGVPPVPFYDPLEFWVREAHKRGLELHAWFNPYRAHHPSGGAISEHSIVKKMPGLAKDLQNGYWWLDPSVVETQQHSLDVIMDVVRRYDIDGVHMDDYFYPYNNGEFPDNDSWENYLAGGGKLNRKDWRRDHVNRFIKTLYESIKSEKPQVRFGLSPFGIWRPGNPPSIRGYDQFNMLYADAKLWLNEGWIDYWSPQLYWPVNQIDQSYPVLLGWWSRENRHSRHIWPGLFTSRYGNDENTREIISQIMIERGFQHENPGHIHFSMRALMNDSSAIAGNLRSGPYRRPALPPAFPWLSNDAPAAPEINCSISGDSILVKWSHPDSQNIYRWVVQTQYESGWSAQILGRFDRQITLPMTQSVLSKEQSTDSTQVYQEWSLQTIAVSAVDQLNNKSLPVTFLVSP